MMFFCKECGGILVPAEDGYLVCKRCGKKYKAEGSLLFEEKSEKKEKVFYVGEVKVEAPKIKGVRCPRCGNDEAYFMQVQTRAADESPTSIYKCTKCGYVWREY